MTISDSWILTKESKHIDNPVSEISCDVDWQDQGFGNRKGQLKLALMRNGQEIAGEHIFNETAKHERESRHRLFKDENLVKFA